MSGSRVLSMAACVRSRLNSASSELSLGRGRHLFTLRTRQFLPDGGEPQPPLVQNLGGEALLFAQQPEQKMLGADVFVAQPLGFFGPVRKHALAFVAKRQIHAG